MLVFFPHAGHDIVCPCLHAHRWSLIDFPKCTELMTWPSLIFPTETCTDGPPVAVCYYVLVLPDHACGHQGELWGLKPHDLFYFSQ